MLGLSKIASHWVREWADGTAHCLGPGDVNLADDLTGHGHTARLVGDVPRVTVTFHLDE